MPDTADEAPAVKPRRSRLGIALLVGGYAIPVAIAITLLFLLDDIVIAVALIVIELVSVIGIRLSLRAPSSSQRPDRLPGEPVLGLPGDIPRGATARSSAKIAFAMFAIVVVLGVVAVIASHMG